MAKKKTPKADKPSPPENLNADANAEWNRVCGELEAQGRLNKADRSILGVYVKLWTSFHTASADVEAHGLVCEHNGGKTVGVNPHYKIQKETGTLLRAILNDLGLTPVSRDFDAAKSVAEPPPLEI